MQQLSQQRNMARHLVVLRRRFRFFVLFLCSSDVIGQETGTSAFKKISRAPRPLGDANIETVFLPAFQPLNEFFGRSDEAESARQVIGRAEGQNAQGNAGINQSASDLCHCAITSGNQN